MEQLNTKKFIHLKPLFFGFFFSTMLLFHFLFFPNSVFAKSPYDNKLKNSQPLKIMFLKQEKSDFNFDRDIIFHDFTGNIDDFSDFLHDEFSIKEIAKFLKVWKPSDENLRWAFGNSNFQDRHIEKKEPNNVFKIVVGDKRLRFQILSNIRPGYQFYYDQGKTILYNPTDESLKYYTLSVISRPEKDSYYSDSFKQCRLRAIDNNFCNSQFQFSETTVEPHQRAFSPINISEFFLNNFDFDYPDNYEGPKISDTYNSNDVSSYSSNEKTHFHFQLNDGNTKLRVRIVDNPYNNDLMGNYILSEVGDDGVETDVDNFSILSDIPYVNNNLKENQKYHLKVRLVSDPEIASVYYDWTSVIFTYSSVANTDGNITRYAVPVSDIDYDDCNQYSSYAEKIVCYLSNMRVSANNFLSERVFPFVKWLLIPEEEQFIDGFNTLKDNTRSSVGSFFGYFDFLFNTLKLFFNGIFHSILGYSENRPCNIFPDIKIFGSDFQPNICHFEDAIGSSNFNTLKMFVSSSYFLLSVFLIRNLFSSILSVLEDI